MAAGAWDGQVDEVCTIRVAPGGYIMSRTGGEWLVPAVTWDGQ